MLQNKRRNRDRRGEQGNLFAIIFLAVALFGALMFTFSRGARQGGEQLTERTAIVAAADILSFAQQMERGLSRVYRRGFSENDISFENSFVSGYQNTNCTANNRCLVFNPQGGAVTYRAPDDGWSSTSSVWLFSGNNQILGVGQDCTADNCVELTLMLPGLPLSLCQALNEKLGVTDSGVAPLTDANMDITTQYTGTFSYDGSDDIGDETAALQGQRAACVNVTGLSENVFYYVLLER